MWRWLTERRRQRLTAEPFPSAWERHLTEHVAIERRLGPELQARLRALTQIFVAEKRWEGCGGLEMTDEIRVTIAAQACVLVLGRGLELVDDVESILVYPSTVVAPAQSPGVFTRTGVAEVATPLLGQAFRHGPVILAWDQVVAGGRDARDGHNVVFHEMAHKIDMLGGVVDGTPPLPDAAHRRRWAASFSAAFLALQADSEREQPSFLRAYGATNEAEFFAVATEAFFEQPVAFAAALPEVFAALLDFYAIDLREAVPAR